MKFFLGQYTDLEGEVIEGNRTELSWSDLSKEKKKLNIANLSNKENREVVRRIISEFRKST